MIQAHEQLLIANARVRPNLTEARKPNSFDRTSLRTTNVIDEAKYREALLPSMGQIEEYLANENAKLMEIASADHDRLGRILKAQLIVEHALNEFLIKNHALTELPKARIPIFKKIQLLADEGTIASLFKPSIIELNEIRNSFGHRLDATVTEKQIPKIRKTLTMLRKESSPDTVTAIEQYAVLVFSLMRFIPKEILGIFSQAMTTATDKH